MLGWRSTPSRRNPEPDPSRGNRKSVTIKLTTRDDSINITIIVILTEKLMSSLIRTLQKRMAKKMGYVRQTQKFTVVNGQPQVVRLGRGEGPILNPDNEPIGHHWPQVSAPTRSTEKVKHAPRGSRRSKHSAAWIAARKERAA